MKIKKGDLVVATINFFGDHKNEWFIGRFDRKEDGRYFVVDDNGCQLSEEGFERIQNISDRRKKFILYNKDNIDNCDLGIYHWTRCSMNRRCFYNPDGKQL